MSTKIKQNGNWVDVAGGHRQWVGTQAALEAALAAGEIPEGTEVVVTDDYDEMLTHYSTEEQFTGKYWIDGKKIYQKTVVNISHTDSTVWHQVATPFSAGYVETLTDSTVRRTSSRDIINSIATSIHDDGSLWFQDKDAYYGTYAVTLEYTKTTD